MIDIRPVRLVRSLVVAVVLAGAFATCDTLTAPKAQHITLAWQGDTALQSGAVVPLTVQVLANGKLESAPHLVVTSSDTTVLTVSTDGPDSLHAIGVGVLTLSVQLVDPILANPGPTLTQVLSVTPSSVGFAKGADTLRALGDTTTLSVTAFNTKNDSIPSAKFTWASTDTTIVKVTTHGRITSVANGTARIKAAIAGDTATATIVVAQAVAHFHITPPFAFTLNALGADTTLTAVGVDSLGSTVAGANPTWILQTPGILSVSPVGVVQSLNNGTTYVYAVRGTARDSVQGNVVQVATRLLVTSPTGFAISAVGGTITLAVAAFDRLNNPVTNNVPTLVSLNPSVAQVVTSTRVVTGVAPGSAQIVARQDAVADTVTVQVANLPVRLVLTSHNDTIPSIGDTLKLRATLYNNLGNVVTGYSPYWYALDTTVVSVLQTGNTIAKKAGATRVIAVLDTLADTATVTVTNAPTYLKILAHYDTLHSIGDSLAIPVDFRNSNGVSLPASAATWTSDDPTVVRVSSYGEVYAIAIGQVYIHAFSGILRDSALVTVTNAATKIVLNSTLDTLTARGQQIQYTATVTNSAGSPVGGTVVWSSTNPAIASVDQTGTVTALTFGTTSIVATSGAVHAAVTVVVHNPTTNYVDNSSVAAYQFGTLKYPYLRIGDGINGADPGDTVFVRVGIGAYSEDVSINKQVTLIGDPTAYLANGRNPKYLPLISHDTGTAGIFALSPAHVSVRTIAIRHTLDGPAVDARSALIQLNQVYVNPSGDPFVNGRGLSVQATSAALVDSCSVQAVHGYGIQMVNVTNGRVGESTVTGVSKSSAADSTLGAGIAVIYGSQDVVASNTLRTVAGAQVLVDSSVGATVSGNALAGESQLMRLVGATSPMVTNNTFNTRLQSGDTYTGSSATDGRSALELNVASGASIVANTFNDVFNSQMDFVHLIGVRGSSGTLLQQNAMNGGRYAVNSAQSTWTLENSHALSANTAVVLTGADTAMMIADTLGIAGSTCVQISGAAGEAALSGGLLTQCGPSGTAAINSSASGADVDVIGTGFSSNAQRAIDATSAHRITVRTATIYGGGVSCGNGLTTSTGAINVTADSVVIVGTGIEGFQTCSAMALAGGVVRVDSNLVTENGAGISIVGAVSTFEAQTNDIFGNYTAGVINSGAGLLQMVGNFWGDSLGPRRSSVPYAAGDSIIGSASVDPVKTYPLYPGIRAVQLVSVDGNNQSAPAGTPLNAPLVVRAIDASGRPVPGVLVTFAATSGGGTINGSSSSQVTTGSDGLARGFLTVGPGTNTVVASAPALGSISFTATGT
jgi:hypothetical protein